MNKTHFGYTKDKVAATLFTFKTESFELSVSDYGTSLVNLIVNDKDGKPVDIALGFDDVTGYEQDNGNFLGCNVGRNANRISNASFSLNGTEYRLEQNDGANNLHSGLSPYSKRMWNVEKYGDDFITFSLNSPHMDQGFPGNVKLYITYKILSDSSFEILYEATPDMDTILNITNHSYFNLNGEGSGNAENHSLVLHADYYTPASSCSIPTGEILPVDNTPMDFRVSKTLGRDINENFQPLIFASGYDHNWITDTSGEIHDIATVTGDKTGISMTMATDYPGVQIYTANFLDEKNGKNGHAYSRRDAVCVEPQFYPDSINRPEFVSPVCRAGQLYKKSIIYKFS